MRTPTPRESLVEPVARISLTAYHRSPHGPCAPTHNLPALEAPLHRRTALSISAALLAAAPLLSACSGQARPGTAAVVGGERITTSALQAQVGDVRAAQNESG